MTQNLAARRDDRLLQRIAGSADADVRVFCIPYAGGGASIFQSWRAGLPPGVELWAAQLPGREDRFREPPFDRLDDLLRVLGPAVRPYLDRPFAFFGHSMGAIISYELARTLVRRGAPQPAHLFVSGCPPLQTYLTPRGEWHKMPDAEFLDWLRGLNGTPAAVLDNPELVRLMTRHLRADFTLVETYRFEPDDPVDCPLSAFGGDRDDIEADALRDWAELTTGPFDMQLFAGDHFFLHEARDALLSSIFRRLDKYRR